MTASEKYTFSFWHIIWFFAVAVLFFSFGSFFFQQSRQPASLTSPPTAQTPAQPDKAPALDAGASPLPALPPFDKEQSPYILTAFSRQGLVHITDAEPLWVMLPPGSRVIAQLIRRGPTPEVVKQDVTLSYALSSESVLHLGGQNGTFPGGASNATAGNTSSAAFDSNSSPTAGQTDAVAANKDTPSGGQGAALTGTLHPVEQTGSYVTPDIPLLPYTRTEKFAPYPMMTITAEDAQGVTLASTSVVVPVSTEMGCRNCHQGPWKKDNIAGISRQTAGEILSLHDKKNGTSLQSQAAAGPHVDCRSCHESDPERLNISAAIHGFHASVQDQTADACASCHPATERSATHFFRDIHSLWGLDCTNCHGAIADHAIALLRAESLAGKKAADVRLRRLSPHAVSTQEEINPRVPWVNLPDCTGCHNFEQKPDPATASAFNKWTASTEDLYAERLDDSGSLRCPSCHGAPHAIYPANNPLGDYRDNFQPMQYQNQAMPLGADMHCAVCHMVPMEFSMHHPLVQE